MTAQLPDAVLDGDLPAHFGRPFAEEHLLRMGRGFTQLPLELVTVSGPDRLSWLHNLTTRDFTNLTPGESTEMMVLDPNGHIQSVAAVIDDGETTWLITDHGCAEPLAQFLTSMQFMLRVEVAVREIAAFGVMTKVEQVPQQIASEALVMWSDPWPRTRAGGAHYGIADVDHPAASSSRTVVVVEKEKESDVVHTWQSAGWEPVGMLAWEAARIVDRRPRPSREVDSRTLPHELDWLRTAVHLEKGCYRGQETVAKIVNLGKPPRRLVYLYLEGPEGDLPEAGTSVEYRSRTVGQLTSVARDADEGPIALALIKRAVPADAELTIGDFVASQEIIVGVEGKSSASPQQRPGAGLRTISRHEVGNE